MSDASVGDGQPAVRPAWWEWLFVPFRYVSGEVALAVGLVAMLAAGAVGYAGKAHFDGVLDMHTGPAMPLWVFLVEVAIDWLCLAVVLLIIGKLVSRTAFRAIDLVGTQALARWPSLLAALAVLPPGFRRTTAALVTMQGGQLPNVPAGDLVVFAIGSLILLVAIVWMVALMYQSYRICANLRGVRAVVSFVVGVLLAEVASKYALAAVLAHAGK